jgi:hypothetical protein
MRKIATILLVIFTLVQAGPLCCSLVTETTVIFMADEEKAPEKMDTEKKAEKKDYFSFHKMQLGYNHNINTAFLHAEHIKHPPCIELQTPPPDFC